MTSGDALPLYPFRRAIALPEQHVLFIPTPKTGCTTILWHLAVDVIGLSPKAFQSAMATEVTASLSIHSRRHWPAENVPDPTAVQQTIRDGWAWVTVVRDPFRRLWSGWQSKILLEEPYFIRRFRREDWYPREVSSAAGIRDAFREFVAALGGDDVPHDLHWASQFDYLRPDLVPYTHIGRTERLQATVDLLFSMVGVDPSTVQARGENPTPLPYDPSLSDDRAREVVADRFGRDCETFGYDVAPPAGDPEGWIRNTEPLVPAVNMIRDRSRRLNTLQRKYARARTELRRTR
jgi:hypothetical protein